MLRPKTHTAIESKETKLHTKGMDDALPVARLDARRVSNASPNIAWKKNNHTILPTPCLFKKRSHAGAEQRFVRKSTLRTKMKETKLDAWSASDTSTNVG